jgi:hypothetical protein
MYLSSVKLNNEGEKLAPCPVLLMNEVDIIY